MPARTPASEDTELFLRLQKQLQNQFQRVFPDTQRPRAVVVVPSLSLDAGELSKISGVHHYEERLLCMLMLLRMPRTHLVYITSQPIHPTIIDYYLHLLPGIPLSHARRRLTLLSCNDASPKPLSQKILERPRLLEKIRETLSACQDAHMSCFNATHLERSLALQLGIPLYATDPALADLGSKSGSREVFREAGVPMPDGFERLRDMDDVAEALALLKERNPTLRRAVVKLNEGFSGEGNALFAYDGCPEDEELLPWIRRVLPTRIGFEARGETWERYSEKFSEMNGIVESFLEGARKQSPSAQCRIDPLGEVSPISTHDQVLGGPSGQVFLGCTFPANEAYRLDVQDAGLRVAEVLRSRGALGRFSVDFISVHEPAGWRHYAIEINLRKGGTTHPNLMLHYLADGAYDAASGLYLTPAGQPRYYYASDNMEDAVYQGLTPDDLIDIAVCHDLHFHGATQQGVVFHLIGALSEFGKLGVLCIGDSPKRAQELYADTVNVLAGESQKTPRVHVMGY
ncbi:MAG: peptide ligase PGM1-related protein [Rhodothermales bacterium]